MRFGANPCCDSQKENSSTNNWNSCCTFKTNSITRMKNNFSRAVSVLSLPKIATSLKPQVIRSAYPFHHMQYFVLPEEDQWSVPVVLPVLWFPDKVWWSWTKLVFPFLNLHDESTNFHFAHKAIFKLRCQGKFRCRERHETHNKETYSWKHSNTASLEKTPFNQMSPSDSFFTTVPSLLGSSRA